MVVLSLALVWASRKYRHYSGNRILPPLDPFCAKRFRMHCNGQPALLDRRYRGAANVSKYSPLEELHSRLDDQLYGNSVG